MRDSGRIAMFLGAGASKAFDVPLTKEILPGIMQNLKNQSLFEGDKEACKTLQDRLTELIPGIERVDQKYVLITEVLSLIDYMVLCALVPAPRAKANDLLTCRQLLERAILDLLPGIHPSKEEKAQPDLPKLARWMFEVGNRFHFSLISTNYDEIIERGLYQCFKDRDKRTERPFDSVNEAVNFGLSWRDGESGKIFQSPVEARHAVLKLHGSVDWMKCELCGWIVCNDTYSESERFHEAGFEEHNDANRCHCGHRPLSPVMIAPSLVRDIRDINLLNVWKAACEELRTADHWFVIGYSLPIEDYAIRAMLIRALKTRISPPRIDVYAFDKDPETQAQTEARYHAFLGNCTYHNTGMNGFMRDVVDQELYVGSPETMPTAQAHELPTVLAAAAGLTGS